MQLPSVFIAPSPMNWMRSVSQESTKACLCSLIVKVASTKWKCVASLEHLARGRRAAYTVLWSCRSSRIFSAEQMREQVSRSVYLPTASLQRTWRMMRVGVVHGSVKWPVCVFAHSLTPRQRQCSFCLPSPLITTRPSTASSQWSEFVDNPFPFFLFSREMPIFCCWSLGLLDSFLEMADADHLPIYWGFGLSDSEPQVWRFRP